MKDSEIEQKIVDILVRKIKKDGTKATMTYEALQKSLKRTIGFCVPIKSIHVYVNDIGRTCLKKKVPMLDCIVINKSTGLPDDDFFERCYIKYEG